MTKLQLAEKIRELPIADQRDLAESILGSIVVTEQHHELDSLRIAMEIAANDALEYYSTDPDVALWQALDGEPIHE